MIQVLTDELDRWLSAEGFFLRHVQVVHKDDALLSDRRSIIALSAFFHFGVYGVLRLIGACLSRECEADVLEGVRHVVGEQLVTVLRLTCSCGAEGQHVVIVGEQQLDQVQIAS